MARKKRNFKVTTPPPVVPREDEGIESLLNLYDEDNNDKGLFNLIDDEIIKLSGSKLFVYKYYVGEDYDPVYMESRTKPISRTPIVVFGHYEPRALEENLSQFGIELTNDQIFIFNKAYIERRIGRSMIPGDVIKPAFQEQKYKVFEVQEDSFESYGVYHLMCHAKLLRESEETLNQPFVDTSEDPGGYFRE